MKHDLRKKVFSGARDPRFGGEATLLECILVIVEEFDGVVKDLWRKEEMGWIQHDSLLPRRNAALALVVTNEGLVSSWFLLFVRSGDDTRFWRYTE